MTTVSLIEGYRVYTSDAELSAEYAMAAPAVSPTPSILSFIGESSLACGAAIGSIIGGTVNKGC